MTDRFDDSTMEDLEEIQSELNAMDRVRIVGLTSNKGRELNGRIGIIQAIDESDNNNGTDDPYRARLPDGRYKVEVEFEETIGREDTPGRFNSRGITKSYSLKRENLEMYDVSVATIARTAEGAAAIREMDCRVETTAQREAREPEVAGWFPAILQGDVIRAREILEYIRDTCGVENAADQNLDATGDTALIGAIQKGHLGIVKLLIEFGANVNRICNLAALRDLNLSYLNMAIMLIDKINDGEAEAIVNALIDAGADVTSSGPKGTSLALATRIESDHAMRLRLCRKILDKGADPNQILYVGMPGLGRNESTALMLASSMECGCYSESDRLELLNMLLEAGADPGIVITLNIGRRESCTAIHTVVSRRQADVLRCLLSTEKGKEAVNVKRREYDPPLPGENNGDGETAITMAVGDDLNQYKANRDIAVQLLKAGADPEIEDSLGVSAAIWLRNPTPKHKELNRLVKKAQGKGPSFWDSDEVRAFIEDGDNDQLQCSQCLVWSDQLQRHTGQKETNYQRCSKCKSVHYCSRACQKKHWKQHKKVCRAPADASS